MPGKPAALVEVELRLLANEALSIHVRIVTAVLRLGTRGGGIALGFAHAGRRR